MRRNGAELVGQTWQTDICIVGAGAAGIAMAHKLKDSGREVTVLESGEAFDGPQEVYRGIPGDLMGRVDAEFLCRSRKRFFGGTTNCWGGWSRPLDAVDFRRRSGVSWSGWPIDRAELEGFYAEAQAICNLGAMRYDDVDYWAQRAGRRPLALRGRELQNSIWQAIQGESWDKRFWRFGQFYCRELETSPTVTLIENANVLQVIADGEGRRVERLAVAALVGGEAKSFAVIANTYVLAQGGIETVRLLLLSNAERERPLGNAGVLGRFFMVHPLIVNAGTVTFREALPSDVSAFYAQEARVRREAAPAAAKEVDSRPLPPEDPREQPGEAAPRSRAGDACSIVVEPYPCQREDPASLVRIWCVLKPTESALGDSLGNFRIILRGGPQRFTIDVNWEQVPNRESCLELADACDPIFGQPQVELDWRLTLQDKETVRTALRMLTDEMALHGATTRIEVNLEGGADEWPTRSTDPVHFLQPGDHHMGTARMALAAGDAYVDRDGKVIGTDNLYVTGSAVFATGGVANPTLTIIALAVRLAAHLRAR